MLQLLQFPHRGLPRRSVGGAFVCDGSIWPEASEPGEVYGLALHDRIVESDTLPVDRSLVVGLGRLEHVEAPN